MIHLPSHSGGKWSITRRPTALWGFYGSDPRLSLRRVVRMETRTAPSVDELVALTPDTRDRSVDFLRAVSITVVVLWHWVFSITHWNAHGALTMPNPIGHTPALWFLTWILQIMPLFLFVGGFATVVVHGR